MNGKKITVTSIMRVLVIILILTSLLILPGACSHKETIDYTGTNTDNQLAGSYKLFNGTQTATIDVKAGKTLMISYSSVVESGELTIRLYNANNVLIYEFPTDTSSIKMFFIQSDDKYLLEVNGNDTKGSFNIQWLTN